MLTAMLGHMYITVQVTAALRVPPPSYAGPRQRCPLHAIRYLHSTQHSIASPPFSAAPRSILHCPSALLSPLRLSFAFLLRHHCSRFPTPHGLCLDALALVLRIRAACHCWSLRSPTPHLRRSPYSSFAGIPARCFWTRKLACLVVSTARSHHSPTNWPLPGSPAAQLTSSWVTALRHCTSPRSTRGPVRGSSSRPPVPPSTALFTLAELSGFARRRAQRRSTNRSRRAPALTDPLVYPE
jgi:hypothetical protein